MGQEILNVSTDITVKDFIELIEEKNIPKDAWISFRDSDLGINAGIKSIYLTERDPEGDIDLILGG